MRGPGRLFKIFIGRRKPNVVSSLTPSNKPIGPRSLALAAAMLFLGACNVTTVGSNGAAVTTAAVSQAGGVQPEKRLTEADIAVPQAFQFMGQTEEMLALHFGTPDLTRRDGDATIHQFRTNTRSQPCVILAVLYEDRGDVPRIRHLSVRRGASEAAEPDQCLRRLALAHKNRRAG